MRRRRDGSRALPPGITEGDTAPAAIRRDRTPQAPGPFAFRRSASTWILVAAWLGVALAGLTVAAVVYPGIRQQHLDALTADAQRCALAFSDGAIDALAGSPGDVRLREYDDVKLRLVRMREVDPRVRFVYLMQRSGAPGAVVFLADSEPPGSAEASKPGDDYPEAPSSPGLQSILRDGQPATEGPLRDSFGVWVTAYAPVRQADDGGARIVVGTDVSASMWNAAIRDRITVVAVTIWVILGLPLGVWTVLRHRLRVTDVIRRLSVALDQSGAAVIIVNRDGRIDYVNGGLCRQTGYSAAELLGRRWDHMPGVGLSRRSRARALRAIQGGETWHGQWINTRKDGTLYPVHGVVSPVHTNRQAMTCIIALFNDVSPLKKAEDELRAAKEQAEAGNQAKSRFLAMMSHEMRTPLNGVIGLTSILGQSSLTAEQQECLGLIRSSGESLLRIIDDLLHLAKIEAGRLELENTPFEARKTIRDTVQSLRGIAAEKELALDVQFTDAVPPVLIADATRLRQILVNLVGNALKFTAQGGVTVKVDAHPGPEGQIVLDVAVQDTGIGIAREKLGELFTPFQQVDASTSRRYGGTGLGLAISKRLCELMGGAISVESDAGQGATFRFTLKAGIAPTMGEVAPRAGKPAAPATRTTPADPSSLHVLVVEDNPVNAMVALKMLRSLGHAAEHVQDGEAALHAYTERRHDVILMDLQMPGKDGWTTTREIRARSDKRGPWIVALTAEAMDGVRERCLDAGMNAYLTKPLVIERLALELSHASTRSSGKPA